MTARKRSNKPVPQQPAPESRALVPAAPADAVVVIGGFRMTKTALVVPEDATFEDWLAVGKQLSAYAGAVHWWVGDWLNHGERKWGEKYAEAVEATGFDYQTLADDKWVAGRVSFRNEKLSFAHHRVVASLPPAEQVALLSRAEQEGWPSARLRKEAASGKQAAAMAAAGPLPAGKYRCVVIDPPWPVEKIEREERPNQRRELDYPVMTLGDIGRRVGGMLAQVAEEGGCHVYLWVTHKHLPAGLSFFTAWGVTFQCHLTWVKPTGMTPYSWQYNTEPVLFGCIGSLPLADLGLQIAFEEAIAFKADTQGHSAKPDKFYDLVRAASPGPRLSLFERRAIPGFDVWGDEAPPSGEGAGDER